MREIKFRAWNKIDHLRCDVVEIVFGDDDNYVAIENGDYVERWRFDDIELMQYTGSKGIDEVPIYEGDGLETADGEFIGIVHFTDGTFMVGDESLWEWDFETKVCGNRFENPELLEDMHNE